MSLKVSYEDIIDLPIRNERNLILADLNQFTEHDYCVTVEVKPDLKANKEGRKEEEPSTHCVWGRPGKHLGVFLDYDSLRYAFTWWEGDEYKCIQSKLNSVKEENVLISVVKNSGTKIFSLYIDGELQEEKQYGEIDSYVDRPITLGIGNEGEEAFPHNNRFAGEYSRFSINNTHKLDEELNASTLVYLDFEKDNLTYYSIHDVSNNGNRARINHSTYKQKWQKVG